MDRARERRLVRQVDRQTSRIEELEQKRQTDGRERDSFVIS